MEGHVKNEFFLMNFFYLCVFWGRDRENQEAFRLNLKQICW